MKFKIQKQGLLNGTSIVQNAINPRGALPILSNILLENYQKTLRLISTDLDICVSYSLVVDSQEDGAITVPAKRFFDIIRELPEGEVSVTTKKNNMVTIESQNCLFKIMGLPKEDFPKLPEFKDKEAIKIEQGVLKEMFALTSFAVSHDEARYILNGILMKIKKNALTLVATDGRRLAIIERKIDFNSTKETQAIIPLKTIQELLRNLNEEKELSLVMTHNQALFDMGQTTVISRLIEGEFPDYQQVVPAPAEDKIIVDREPFLLAVKRASLLATPDYQAVKMEVFKNRMILSKSTPDIGESREDVEVEYQGKEMVIGFNPSFLVDALKNLKIEKVCFEIAGADKPGVIRTDSNYIYVVLPMRLS
ncbi:MAG: DNA polymerase III subunit beta [Candidatus Omnitrophica bacterium]|nr:DNA polymerase III subunit beta [Candidatus Omnitrophota bacterium]